MKKVIILIILVIPIVLFTFLIKYFMYNNKEEQINDPDSVLADLKNDPFIIDEQLNKNEGTFYLGMTMEDVLLKLNELGVNYEKMK